LSQNDIQQINIIFLKVKILVRGNRCDFSLRA